MSNKGISNRSSNRINFLMALLISVSLSGCVTTGSDGHSYVNGYCISCLNNPITGQPYNYSKDSADYKRAQAKQSTARAGASGSQGLPYQKGRVKFSVRTPVDRAYLKIKREFGFFTRKERLRGFGYNNKGWLDSAGEFRYEALPGVSYHMREYTGHQYGGRTTNQTIDMVLETNGRGTDIEVNYWARLPKAELQKFGASLKARVKAAL